MPDQTPPSPSSPPSVSTDPLEQNLRSVVQTLYEISVSTYRNDAPNPADILVSQVTDLLAKFDQTRTEAEGVGELFIPREVIGYVEHGRNPDIYTREFVELAVKQNQYLNGKQRAFQSFRDILAAQISTTFPELRADVNAVLENTGGGGGGGGIAGDGMVVSVGNNGGRNEEDGESGGGGGSSMDEKSPQGQDGVNGKGS